MITSSPNFGLRTWIRVQNMALLSDLVEGVSDANRPSLSLDFKDAQCIADDLRRRCPDSC